MRSSDGVHLFPGFGYAHVHGICSSKGGSRFNLQEGEVIAGWLKSNRASIEKHYDKPISDAVGIITPFAAQFDKICKALIDVELPALDFKVGTVHALQGAERDIVIFSPVYGFMERGSRFFFDQGVNMLNVAVSRAKDSFLVFGEMAIFDPTSRTPSGLLAHYLFKEESNELTDIPLPPRPKANFSARISSLEGHVKVLSNVIDQARNSVVIVSPFISINAIEQDELVPKIRKAVSRDVRVVVYTDAFLDKEGTGLRETAVRGRAALEEAGAELKILNGIHSKTLCRDRDLFIEGSFNWLSASRGAKSQFRRYEASLCYQGTDAAQVIEEALSEIESLQPSVTEGTH